MEGGVVEVVTHKTKAKVRNFGLKAKTKARTNITM